MPLLLLLLTLASWVLLARQLKLHLHRQQVRLLLAASPQGGVAA